MRKITPWVLAAAATAIAAPAWADHHDEAPQAGAIPPATIDSDGDGIADAWDRDGDGRADAWDTNGDGMPDAMDNDGDGQPDVMEDHDHGATGED